MRAHKDGKGCLELHPGSRRILEWLARYPLQRLEDLEVALAPWHSRATISRCLASLLEAGLIEAILPGITRGKRLYHLSHKGAIVLAGAHGAEPPRFPAEREKLSRMLPRLPVTLPLQDCVNGLVSGAASALTRQGRRALLVRWDWQRDYTHTFFFQARKQSLSVHLDGVLALCLRYDPAYPSEEPQEVWYTLLLLRSLLDDTRLLRQRLDRLLCWRESAERWPTYSQMPPVLILATTPRQTERWHLVSEQLAEARCLDPLRGAIACFPAEEANAPWRLAWRTLDTNRPCHPQDLLVPQSHPGIPGLAESNQRGPLPANLTQPDRRQRHPYDLECAAQRSSAYSAYHLAAFHLTPIQWTLLPLLYAHPLLSIAELAAFSGFSGDSLEKALAGLQRLSYLEARNTLEMQGKGRMNKRWALAENGLHVLAAASGWHVLRLARRQSFPAPLQQRGLASLLNQFPHTLGVYAFFARLAALPGDLHWWESGMSCARQFRWQRRWHSFQPDACAEYQNAGQHPFRFWLEWDQGTMNVRDLTRKFSTYAAYLDAHEWSREHRTLPLLLFVVPDVDQERRVSRCARDVLLDTRLLLYTTTRALLHSRGLDAPIWRQVILQATRESGEGERIAVLA
jgi:hypothetical protein